jgi:prevent-host-death family protein
MRVYSTIPRTRVGLGEAPRGIPPRRASNAGLSPEGDRPIMAIQIAILSHSPMKQQEYSVAEARDRLAELVHEAEHGRPIRITRRGKRAAVLVSEEEFQRSHGRQRQGPGDAILAWRKKYGGVELTDAQIDRWRDRSIGRVPDFSGKE